MASTLIYNGVTILDCLTEQLQAESVYSADGVDYLYTLVHLQVRGVFNPQLNSYVKGNEGQPVALPGAAPDVTLNAVVGRLKQPRANLVFKIDGRFVLDALFVNDLCDPSVGPTPRRVNVVRIDGGATFIVQFAVTFAANLCNGADLGEGEAVGGRPALKSLRWSMHHDVDGDSWLTTRVVVGRAVFDAAALSKTMPAHAANLDRNAPTCLPAYYANLLMHPVPPGFKRQRVRIEAAPNGYELAYVVVDREETLPLGSLNPATRLEAVYAATTAIGEEGKSFACGGMVTVNAVGPKEQLRYNLFVVAVRIALAKLTNRPTFQMITSATIEYFLHETAMRLTVQARYGPPAAAKGNAAGACVLIPDGFGLLPDDDLGDLDSALEICRGPVEPKQALERQNAVAPALRFGGTQGTYAGWVMAAILKAECVAPDQPVNLIPSAERVAEFDNGGDIQVAEVTEFTLPDVPTGLSTEATSGADFYEAPAIQTRYHTDEGLIVLPVCYDPLYPTDANAAPVVVSIHAPMTIKTVVASTTAVGSAAPLLPSPNTGDDADVLMRSEVQPAAPVPAGNGAKAWMVDSVYWYARAGGAGGNGVLRPGDSIPTGKLITDPDPKGGNTIPGTRFIDGLVPGDA